MEKHAGDNGDYANDEGPEAPPVRKGAGANHLQDPRLSMVALTRAPHSIID